MTLSGASRIPLFQMVPFIVRCTLPLASSLFRFFGFSGLSLFLLSTFPLHNMHFSVSSLSLVPLLVTILSAFDAFLHSSNSFPWSQSRIFNHFVANVSAQSFDFQIYAVLLVGATFFGISVFVFGRVQIIDSSVSAFHLTVSPIRHHFTTNSPSNSDLCCWWVGLHLRKVSALQRRGGV